MSPPPNVSPSNTGSRPRSGALAVAAGILASRLMGLLRERVFAHYLGNSIAAGAFKAALRIPNFLQNLFGEGVLSGSFIPVYAGLLGEKRQEEADALAGAVFGLLSLATGLLVGLGMVATPLFVDAVAWGFEGEVRTLSIRLVRILFPATGLLVLSAWCLGILNSHRRFFLSYAAPVIWNLALIAALVLAGGKTTEAQLVEVLAYATVAGSFLQFAVQVPQVRRLMTRFQPFSGWNAAPVRQVLSNFAPVVVGRGVVQFSAYVDTALASLLSVRSLSALAYAQTLYLIPVSLFGMSVSAAELPEMSRTTGTPEEVAAKLRERITRAARRIVFFVIPSAAAFLFLGDVVAGALLQTGRFTAADTRYVWYLLMGATVGLTRSTLGRLYSSAFYALKDPRTPLRVAMVRVSVGAVSAYLLGVRLPAWAGWPLHLGAVFITASSGLAAWLEYALLKRNLSQRIGPTGLPGSLMVRLWTAATLAAGVGLGVKLWLARVRGVDAAVWGEWAGGWFAAPSLHPVLTAAIVLPVYGLLYFSLGALMGVPEAKGFLTRALRRRARSR